MTPLIPAVQRLLQEWDPLCVVPDLIAAGLPPSEYDDYAPYIAGLLEGQCSIEQLLAHLHYCRTQAMGLPQDQEADLILARRLHALLGSSDSWSTS